MSIVYYDSPAGPFYDAAGNQVPPPRVNWLAVPSGECIIGLIQTRTPKAGWRPRHLHVTLRAFQPGRRK